MKTGILLVNLGTPKAANPLAVGIYLREFLMDPLVIDIPKLWRWLLVHGMIVPFRSFSSAKLYQNIWTKEGSPLLIYHLALAAAVQKSLGSSYVVEPAMRYGQPSIKSAILNLKEQGVGEIKVIPLYPQYSLAASESSIQKCQQLLMRYLPDVAVSIQPAFYDDPLFLDAFEKNSKEVLKNHSWDHVLFSFHGLPERHMHKVDATGNFCLTKTECCHSITNENLHCYRAQSFATAKALAKRLALTPDQYTVCFQSRLGRTPWIRPYTDQIITQLAKKGIKKLAVVVPSFVADCLETLEEISIRGKTSFLQSGGEQLHLVPSLNANPEWVSAVVSMAKS